MSRHRVEPWRESSLPRIASTSGLTATGRRGWLDRIATSNVAQQEYMARLQPRQTEAFSLESAVLRRAAMETDLCLSVPAPARTLIDMIHRGKLPPRVAAVVMGKCPLGGAETFAVVEEAARAPAPHAGAADAARPNVLEVLEVRVLEVTVDDPFSDVPSFQEDMSPLRTEEGAGSETGEAPPRGGGMARTMSVASRTGSPTRCPSFYAVDDVEQQLHRASIRTVRGKSFSDALCCTDVSRTLRSRLPLTAPKEGVVLGFAAATGAREMALRAEAKLLADTQEARPAATVQQLQRRHVPRQLVADVTSVDSFYRHYAPVPQFERARCDRAFKDYDAYLFLTHDQLFHTVADDRGVPTAPAPAADDHDDDDVSWNVHGGRRGPPALSGPQRATPEAITARMTKALREAGERTAAQHRERLQSRGLTPQPTGARALVLVPPTAATPQPVVADAPPAEQRTPADRRALSPAKLSDRLRLLALPPPRKVPASSKTCDDFAELKRAVAVQAQGDAAIARRITVPVYLNLRSFV